MTQTTTLDPVFQRMIEDLVARNRGPASQKHMLRAYKRFAAWLGRSPGTATADDLRNFQRHLAETKVSTSTRNATMSGLRFLHRVTLRRHDLAAEIYLRWLHSFGRLDEWIVCLTARTVVRANQEQR